MVKRKRDPLGTSVDDVLLYEVCNALYKTNDILSDILFVLAKEAKLKTRVALLNKHSKKGKNGKTEAV